MYLYKLLKCLVPAEARRECHTPWNSSYQMVVSDMWLLGIVSKCSQRASSALNTWVISPTHFKIYITFPPPPMPTYITFLFVDCMCECTHAHSTVHLWRTDDKFQKFVLSFHLVSPRDWTQVVRLTGKHSWAISPTLILISKCSESLQLRPLILILGLIISWTNNTLSMISIWSSLKLDLWARL